MTWEEELEDTRTIYLEWRIHLSQSTKYRLNYTITDFYIDRTKIDNLYSILAIKPRQGSNGGLTGGYMYGILDDMFCNRHLLVNNAQLVQEIVNAAKLAIVKQEESKQQL